jgi:hypothetical protein
MSDDTGIGRVKLKIDATPNVVIDYMLSDGGAPAGLLIKYGRDIVFEPPDPAPNPQPQHGKPRMDYPRYSVVLPDSISMVAAAAVFAANFEQRRSVIYSYDDAGQGDLSDVTVELHGLPDARHAEFTEWYARNYPGVKVIFS